MKNKNLFLLPLLALIITGCSGLKFTPGFNTSESGYQNGSNNAAISLEYFDGDTFESSKESSEPKASIVFNKESSTTELKTNEQVSAYYSFALDSTYNDPLAIGEIKNLAKNEGGLRVGSLNSNEFGVFSFALPNTYTYAIIYAKPYRGVIEKIDTTEYYVDDAAININDSKFIKLDDALDESNRVSLTRCVFKLGDTGASEFVIKAAPKRAIIDYIELF